jgi:glycosyltransferase involved in cell wall biosynthesis
MNTPIFFSIVIPSYNRGSHILKTIRSILNQPFSNIEIIVINDGSKDETADIIKAIRDSESRIHYYEIENSERAAARNHGLKYVKGIYVNYFDSDDLLLPCLDKLYSFIVQNHQPDVVYGNIQHVDENDGEVNTESFAYGSFTKNLLHNNFLACGSVFLKREVAQNALFHEDRRLSSAEDWELWLRIHTRYVFMQFPEYIFKQVHHQGRSLRSISPEAIEARDKYFAELTFNNKELRAFYGYKSLNLFIADRYTFIALAWSGQNWSKTFFYWLKAFTTSWSVVIRKRFWAVFFKLIFR